MEHQASNTSLKDTDRAWDERLLGEGEACRRAASRTCSVWPHTRYCSTLCPILCSRWPGCCTPLSHICSSRARRRWSRSLPSPPEKRVRTGSECLFGTRRSAPFRFANHFSLPLLKAAHGERQPLGQAWQQNSTPALKRQQQTGQMCRWPAAHLYRV